MKNKKYFYIGLFIFYLLIFFSPFKIIHFAAYLISTFFFYSFSKDIKVSLLYTLILSLFSDIGLGSSFFKMEPAELNLGSGYWFTPMTFLILGLLPFAIIKKLPSIKFADISVVLFFIYSIIGLQFFPYDSVLFGIISLGEVLLAYFLLRTFISEENINHITTIVISMLIFQAILGGFQLLLQRPLSILSESSTFIAPYGLTTPEDVNLYRIAGTFVHPNNLAAFILTVLPFIFLYKIKDRRFSLLKILPMIILFFTYSRASWAIFVLVAVLLFITKQIHFRFPKEIPLYYYLIPISFTILFVILTPYLNARLNSLPQAFEEGGSWDIRTKLFDEGMSLVSQYPITGVGLNRSVQVYAESPVTDIFEITGGRKFYKIHNTYLEMVAEIGIPGLLFFVLFLFLVLKRYFTEKFTYPKNAAFFGLLGLIGISMFNPFLHASQFRYFFLLAAIILA